MTFIKTEDNYITFDGKYVIVNFDGWYVYKRVGDRVLRFQKSFTTLQAAKDYTLNLYNKEG